MAADTPNDLRDNAPLVRLVTRLNVGGPARHALILTRELQTEFPTVLAVGHTGPREGELTDPKVHTTRLPLTRELNPINDAKAVAAVRRLLTRTNPWLLHTHMAKAGTLGRAAAQTMAKETRPLTVHTFHGHVLEGYFKKPVERAFLEIERRLARRTDRLIAVSPQVKDELLDLGIGRPDQIDVVPLGLDLDAFLDVTKPTGELRTELDVPPDAPLVGIVGRLVPIKDVGTTIDAIARLNKDVHLAVVGDGELRPALEQHARDRALADRVHFTGWRRDIAATVADLDVVVLSSRNEGTPVALIEALAAARPVVGTDVGGVRFVVQDHHNGFLVPPGDSNALADRINRLLADPHLRQQMGAHGRAHVRDRFSSKRLVADIRALYTELRNGRPRSRAAAR
jgi:glycosyltransferase involved in cell wall biosynthesis